MRKIKRSLAFKFRLFMSLFFVALLTYSITAYISTYANFLTVSSSLHASGIDGTIVYLNDVEKDWYYYNGLNYTQSSNGTLPSGTDQELYKESNLAFVQITYDSEDFNTEAAGTVSTLSGENQNKYIYYKVMPVNTNETTSTSDDYILIELIDNPFTNRPNNKGFNGWVTSQTNVVISYDSNYYKRYAKVPVTYSNNKPDNVVVTFTANWVDAKVARVNNSNSWSNAIASLNTAGMKRLETVSYTYEPYNMNGYYRTITLNYGSSCSGYYNTNGSRTNRNCWCQQSSCTYIRAIQNEYYDENVIYYTRSNSQFSVLDPSTLNLVVSSTTANPEFTSTYNMSSYYRMVNLTNGQTYNNLYTGAGVLTSGTCSTSGGCHFYELIQYYNSSENQELYDSDTTYYYLVTRDTNIIVLESSISNTWSSSENKPFTLTGIYNGTNYNATWTVGSNSYYGGGVSVICYADTTIENLTISAGSSYSNSNSEPTSSSSGNYAELLGRFHNVKIGRGITRSGTYRNFSSIVGGANSGSSSSSDVKKYTLMIESGYYNSLSIANGAATGTNGDTVYIEAKAIYGNDYDRASSNNSALDIYYCASGSWGDNYYAPSTETGILFDLNLKSGYFGSENTDYSSGIYVGGRYGGVHHNARKIIMEGGHVFNLIGGPLTASNRAGYNDSYIYIKGGEVDMITGGAGETATYGNRIIQITGGTINYSVFGGSNGYQSSDGNGTVNGTSFIYVGGNSTIGSTNNMTNNLTKYGAESGSIFGIGNGRAEYPSIGSSDNSHIIIADVTTINRNVYGGGNYATVGISSTLSSTHSKIDIIGGTVKGSVYGGGNNNGAGSDDTSATVNITMKDGSVEGSIYGGSNQLGIIYGSTNVNINGGTVESVYGGGQGGHNTDSDGTFVAESCNVTIGSSQENTIPTINNVYGGSAYGTVNGDTISNSVSSYGTTVIVNKGNILGSVYGGGKGSNNYVPYVEGNISVTINGGTINNVYGGNDANGVPNGTVKVYLKGGNVTSTYGGGNASSVTTSDVYLQGGQSINIFGGSNTTGNVTTSNINTSSGTATTIYGGNNQGGTTATSNVIIDGGNIANIYGGGRLASTNTTNLRLKSSSNTISNAFGGGESANVTTETKVTLEGANVTNLFGGSNTLGTVLKSTITTTSGSAYNIYGGNNVAGETTTSNVTINGGTINNNVYGGGMQAQTINTNVYLKSSANLINSVFGGGSRANIGDQENSIVGNTNVYLQGATVTNIYGGSDASGTVDNSHITTTSGTATNIYGGNNFGGFTTNTNVTINGGAITENVFGGGKNANSGTTRVILTTANNEVPNVYGGGHQAPVTTSNITLTGCSVTNIYGGGNQSGATTSNVNLNGGRTTNTFGGSNNAGTVITSNVTSTAGTHTNIYGGNNFGGSTTNTNVDINGGTITNVYGGGNEAHSGNTNVDIADTTISGEVYGGGNEAGINTTTNVSIEASNITGNVYGGGNAGTVGTNTYLHVFNSNLGNSIYAGGNGASAIVYGNTIIDIDGTTNITNHVFGGGNAAETGTIETNNSSTSVNIAGANIGGNVYGGANTSRIYGSAHVNIGSDVATAGLTTGDIIIDGTVFGGGETNTFGSENYDYNFISVTDGLVMNINGADHNNFTINGSIFGSGNAARTVGDSYVNISNYGSATDIKHNISIQRVTYLTISNSVIELSGAADRTNDYNLTKFCFSRIDELKLKNNSTLYLKNNANLLQKLSSLVDINNVETKAAVTIGESTITKNVNNRIYMLEGQNLNIATEQNVSAYGEVSGMTFFGMYNYDRNGNISTALYSNEYTNGDNVASSEIYYFSSGSYVIGKRKENHNITIDGFYTNEEDEENEETIKEVYIDPTSNNIDYYMWVVGETVFAYDVDLTASKYSTLGSVEFAFPTFSDPNTIFNVVGFNYNNLNSDVTLIDYNDIPRIASTSDVADNVMGLAIKSGPRGWITDGSTSFLTEENDSYIGTSSYLSENSNVIPSFVFYLYHSKNIGTTDSMGTVTISLLVITPTANDLQMDVERININVNMSRILSASSEYEGTITHGKKYEMFATSPVNITNKSSFSTYYSLFLESDTNVYRSGYHRSLVSNYVLPENTKITMIDFASGTNPQYYYYVVTAQDVINAQNEMLIENEVSYNLSKFIKMGSNSPNNYYDDAAQNNIYYDDDLNVAQEEFVFQVDFGESNINTDVTNKYLFIEMRNSGDQTIISVLGIEQPNLVYNLYNNSNAIIDVTGNLSEQVVYTGDEVIINVETNFIQQTINSNLVNDTNFADQQLGVKLTIIDENGNIVNNASLLGTTFTYNDIVYYPRVDGSVRIKLAERVANVLSRIVMSTNNSALATGTYTIRVESFGSPDGIYYGLTSSDYVDLNMNFISKTFGLSLSLPANQRIIEHATGLTQSNNNSLIYTINYSSGLDNPNIRLKLYRRDYSAITTTTYELVDLDDYVTNNFQATSNEKEYKVITDPLATNTLFIYLKDNLVTGTYKLVFSLYDNNKYIGDMHDYIIIK